MRCGLEDWYRQPWQPYYSGRVRPGRTTRGHGCRRNWPDSTRLRPRPSRNCGASAADLLTEVQQRFRGQTANIDQSDEAAYHEAWRQWHDRDLSIWTACETNDTRIRQHYEEERDHLEAAIAYDRRHHRLTGELAMPHPGQT